MSIKINNQDIVAINKGNQVITDVYKGSDLLWQFNTDPLDRNIYFADPEVGRVLHANGLIAKDYKASKRELATITTLNPDNSLGGSYFYNNKVITKFPELQYCTGLSELIYAFTNCSNLTEVGNIPEGVTSMRYTFQSCKSLINAPTIPNSVTDMGSTFSYCESLIDAPSIPNSVTDMGSTFNYCTSLVNAPTIIPEGVTNMRYTFNYCESLIDAPNIPEGVTDMDSTFNRCSNLTEAPTIPEGVTSMSSTFAYCYGLVDAPNIPEGVTDMDYTFSWCTSLINAPTIPSNVTTMIYTFQNCTRLDGLFIFKPLNPPYYYDTFYNANLVRIYVPDESVNSYKSASGWRDHSSMIYPMSDKSDDDIIFVDREVGRVLKSKGLIADAEKSSIEELATITTLNPGTSTSTSYFGNNTVITRFPELQYFTGLRSLRNAFRGCSNLTEVGDIPEGVTDMHYTFNSCYSLIKAPIIPSSVTDMTSTFYACTSIDGIFVIKPVTPPTYHDGTFVFVDVVRIYVPDGSVSTYKSASGWSAQSSKIYPMSQLPG